MARVLILHLGGVAGGGGGVGVIGNCRIKSQVRV